jgi:hypothetical protein
MIFFATLFKDAPIHPRLEMQISILENEKINYSIYFGKNQPYSKVSYLLNMFNLLYFRKDLIKKISKTDEFKSNEIIHIYDLQLLPLAKIAHKKNKKVIYETLDDSVYLHFHQLTKRFKFLSLFKKSITFFFKKKEQRLIKKYCNKVIINSPNLKYISEDDLKCELIYYSSPFEKNNFQFDKNKRNCLLYVGQIDVNKGFYEMLNLSNELKLTCYLIGPVRNSKILSVIKETENIVYFDNMSSSQLENTLAQLNVDNNFIGLSIILPENESYAKQEANKDIDYLCMGIPFITNDRVPSLEKISYGCAINQKDVLGLHKLVSDFEYYKLVSENCKLLYNKLYKKDLFETKYMSIINTLRQ